MFGFVFVFKQKTAYEMRISDWSSDVCSSDLEELAVDALILDAVSDRPARRVRRIELAVGIARAEAQSRRPLARIDDALGAARAVPRGRDRLEEVVAAAADVRTAGAQGRARIGAPEPVNSEERRIGKEGVTKWRLR